MSGSNDAVFDASVAAQLYAPEPLTTLAVALVSRLSDPATILAVPDLFFAECANIFWKKARRQLCTDAKALAALANIQALRWTVTAMADLAADALTLALAHGITAYDGCYVALANRLGVPLYTADQKLINKLAGAFPNVIWLGTLTIPPPAAP